MEQKKTGIDAPCKNCKKRDINCHSYCKDYIEFRMNLEERNTRIRKEKMIENAVEETITNGIYRSKGMKI